jgi:hypothetical protein
MGQFFQQYLQPIKLNDVKVLRIPHLSPS